MKKRNIILFRVDETMYGANLGPNGELSYFPYTDTIMLKHKDLEGFTGEMWNGLDEETEEGKKNSEACVKLIETTEEVFEKLYGHEPKTKCVSKGYAEKHGIPETAVEQTEEKIGEMILGNNEKLISLNIQFYKKNDRDPEMPITNKHGYIQIIANRDLGIYTQIKAEEIGGPTQLVSINGKYHSLNNDINDSGIRYREYLRNLHEELSKQCSLDSNFDSSSSKSM